MKKIIYIKPHGATFINGDQELLSRHFEVKAIALEQNKGNFRYLLNILKMCFVLLVNGFTGKYIFACWFADYHSAVMTFMARITGSKSVVFIGGQEAICYHELNKGVYRKKIRSAFVAYSLRKASLIISNHQSLIYHENSYYNAENPHIDGIAHYVKNLHTPVEIVYNGIDPAKFSPDPQITKQKNLVLTVGTMNQIGDFYNKGFDMFIQAAAAMPEFEFILIGLKPTFLEWTEQNYKVSEIRNLRIIPSFCPHEVLRESYNKAAVFVQCSITEGMPNTLSEAMLLGCVPVGSNINGIPDAIGDTGVIVKHRQVDEIKEAIMRASVLQNPGAARARVTELFSFDRREQQLKAIFTKL